jgi:hypothetical protein
MTIDREKLIQNKKWQIQANSIRMSIVSRVGIDFDKLRFLDQMSTDQFAASFWEKAKQHGTDERILGNYEAADASTLTSAIEMLWHTDESVLIFGKEWEKIGALCILVSDLRLFIDRIYSALGPSICITDDKLSRGLFYLVQETGSILGRWRTDQSDQAGNP